MQIYQMRYILVISFCLLQFEVLASDSFFDKDQWSVSGYLKLKFQAPNQKPTAIEIDDLSIFVSANINRWINPFIEAEVFSVPLWKSGDGLKFNNAQFTIERLYNDIQVSEDNTIRLGKFLSPISRWNSIHAAPLVWTTNRPITTRFSFANYISGIKFRHEFDFFSGHAIEFFWQPYQEFLPKSIAEQYRQYQNVAGLSWILQENLDSYYSLNFQHSNVKDSDETRSSFGFNGFLQQPDFEVESELIMTLVNTDKPTVHNYDWGGYLQFTIPIPLDLNIITRYEHFEFSDRITASDSALAGLVYRPYSKLSFKLEWQQTWGSVQKNGTGLYSSVAVMF